LIEVFLDFYKTDDDADGFLNLVSNYIATFQDKFLLTSYPQDVMVDVSTWKILRIRGLMEYFEDEDTKDTEWDGSWHGH
jgi:hypothetical protein